MITMSSYGQYASTCSVGVTIIGVRNVAQMPHELQGICSLERLEMLDSMVVVLSSHIADNSDLRGHVSCGPPRLLSKLTG
jgi:hypothetical protein